MASFESIGFINAIKYLQDSVIVYMDEYHKGYKKSNGEIVDDKYVSFKTIWKPYFKNYISKHFGEGMLVQVKGEILPYALEHSKMVDGYTVLGQTINLYSYPRQSVKYEKKAIKDSALHSNEAPDLDDYNQPDF